VRVWRDWVLLAVLSLSALIEGTLRSDVLWRPVALALALALVWTLLWRRTHPLLMLVIAFVPLMALSVASLATGVASVGLYTNGFILLLPYALLRWGSGREVLLGLPLILTTYVLGIVADYTTFGEAIAGLLFGLFPALLGVLVRLQNRTHTQEKEQVKLIEREQLARDLHDTVAHHVSAIAVRAQAGRYVAATDPERAIDSLRVIEEEASRALNEMRVMVGALRRSKDADLAPQNGIRDIPRLAHDDHTPVVAVHIAGSLDGLSSAVDAAVYRIAQESITNAVRHARNASRVEVRVHAGEGDVGLTVTDDGATAGAPSEGYGLLGMRERAALLGGTFEAGPQREGGWRVTAVLPRDGGYA
jgi:signal transduction histidine kinase